MRFDVAVYAPLAAPLYLADDQAIAAGAEYQAYSIARSLAGAGMRVCHIIFSRPGLPAVADGVTLIRLPPAARSSLHTITACAEFVRRADARLYIQRCAGWETGVVGLVARGMRRKFVFSSSSDSDFSGERLLDGRERRLFGVGTRLVNATVVQSTRQLKLARDHRPHLKRVEVIPNFGPEPHSPQQADGRDRFLWIGRLDNNKQPLRFMELAEHLPETRFTMVLAGPDRSSSALWSEIERRATRLPNLELLDPRPRAALADLYEQSIALVNTSRIEGFPNTFLEAWSFGVPVLSLHVDPNDVITTHRLGIVAHGSPAVLLEGAREMVAAPGSMRFAANAQWYVERNHAAAAVGKRWAALVDELL